MDLNILEVLLNFIRQIAEKKISFWCEELNSLSSIAKSHPHAAYAAFAHRVMSHWRYLFQITDFSTTFLSETLQPLEETSLQLRFIPSLSDRNPPGEFKRKCLALLTHLQGIVLQKPATFASAKFSFLKLIYGPFI